MPFIPTDLKRAFTYIALTALVLSSSGGCSEDKGPKTFPVNGKVAFDKGGAITPLVGCIIEFKSLKEPLTIAYGEVKEDGSFTVATQQNGIGRLGAIEGEHQIRLRMVVEDNDDRPRRKQTVMNPRFQRFESSGLKCTVPLNDPLVLKVSR